MVKTVLAVCMLVTGAMFAGAVAAAGDPTMHEVYQAAQSGRMGEAMRMMDQVLHDHPNSGKAHFVEAELLARQGRMAGAAAELRTAERLAPGLPFARPAAVDSLQNRIMSRRSTTLNQRNFYSTQAARRHSFPWGGIFVGFVLIAAVLFFAYKTMQRRAAMFGPRPSYGGGLGAGQTLGPVGPGAMGSPMGMRSGGMGSTIMGGLATGAAVGAGMVAGEALMNRMIDGGGGATGTQAAPMMDTGGAVQGQDQGAMGGNDFGITDNSSWDDSTSADDGSSWGDDGSSWDDGSAGGDDWS